MKRSGGQSIRGKILIAAALLLATVMGSGAAVVILGGELGEVSLDLYDKSFISSRYAQRVHTDFVRLEGGHSDADLPLTSREDKAALDNMLTELDVVSERSATGKEKAITAAVRAKLTSLTDAAPTAQRPTLASIDKMIKHMSQRFADDALDHREQAEFLVERLRTLLVALAVTSILGVGIFALFLMRAVVNPLRRLTGVIASSAEDVFEPPAELAGRSDEIGQMIAALADRHRAAETLKRLRADQAQAEAAVRAAEMSNRAKSEFLAVMSHEIRTPMNGVLGMVQAMQRDRLSKVQRGRLDLIGQSGQALLAILNDILDLSKIEAGKLELEESDFDLAGQAHDVFAAFQPTAQSKRLKFTIDVTDAAQGVFRGDAARVRQILYNLLSNGVKFTSVGGVDLRVDHDGERARLSVSDSGVGMAPDQIARLFDKFVQADSSISRRFGGTGLGLAICKQLCEAMGGDVIVRSELGKGSCFTAELPLARSTDADADALARRTAPDGPDLNGRTLRVLAAEDNPMNQIVLKTLLGQAGVAVVVVGDGVEAISAWEQGHWDLILMDVQMPVMDGLAATAHIRRRELQTGRPAMPIIALTANAMRHQIDSYRAAGMTGFVAKPIMIAELFAAIEEAVNTAPPAEILAGAAAGERS